MGWWDGRCLLPGVYRDASRLGRWSLGTHQDAVGHERVQATLDAFAFRCNGRSSGHHGLVVYQVVPLAVGYAPDRCCRSIANPRPGSGFQAPATAS